MTTLTHRTTHSWSADIPRVIAAVVGAVFLAVGIAGFAVTGFDGFASSHGESLLGFHVNPLHNLVHIAIGVAGLAMAIWLGMARTFGWLLFGVYGAAFIYGLFAVNKSWDILALNAADNGLHLVFAAVGLMIAWWPVGKTKTSRIMASDATANRAVVNRQP